ncbi:hypothetical protein [Acrocarpospora phusangensis]|nr:hypothetical protein [Acrocarpospora phusangensis]
MPSARPTPVPAARADVPKSLYILLSILTAFVVLLAVVVALLLTRATGIRP